ncbi:MAG: response regulator [Candidatus Alkaliphilus sp. MAG34]|nr:response regulator [Clostridiales bacterium]
MKNQQIDELMKTAQKTFIDELSDRIEKMEKLLTSCRDGCSAHDTKEISNFFHIMNGTAATLGLNYLADVGRIWETRLRDIIEQGIDLDTVVLKDIYVEIISIKHRIDYLKEDRKAHILTKPGEDYINISDRGKILLVDDDITILKLLENALTTEGYTVYICDDSLSAFDLISVARPDVIMLDIMMPGINGYELLEKIKVVPEYSHMHVIFLSAIGNVDDRIKGLKLGADDYITKPFVIDEVMARIETVLRRTDKYKKKLLNDDLTDAYSRYYFSQRIKEEIERYKRNGTIFSIAFIDIDHYKIVNDRYGHQAGDFVLQEIVAYLDKNIRKCDSLYRYGGEEFIILLPDTSKLQTYAVIDRLRKGFAREPIPVGGTTIKVTFSAGIAQTESKDITGEQLVGNADRAMYKAKKLGRNRTVVYDSEMIVEDFGKTLLLVDDENTILRLLRDRLSNIGYNVVMAKNGSSAIELVKRVSPDVVILDLILPDMDGLEVCRQIKKGGPLCSTKIIILSKKKEKSDIAKGLYAGADDYLTKPFSMVELEARIMRVLNK